MAIIHLCKWREKEEPKAVYEEKRLRVDSVCISYKKGSFSIIKPNKSKIQTSMLWLSTEAFSYPNARKINGASEADIVQMKM